MSRDFLGSRLFRGGLFRQFFGFVEQLTLLIRTFTAGTKLLMFVEAKLFFVPRQLLLQLDVFQLKGFDAVDVRRGRRIHADYYPIPSQSLVLQQVMAITSIKPWTDTVKAGALSFVFDRQTIQQPGQFTARQSDSLLSITLTGPVKATFLQPTLIEPEAIGLPVQDLEFVLPPVTEHKQAF